MKKQRREAKSLKLNKDTVRLLNRPDLRKVVAAGLSNDSCFPDICQEKDTSGC